jgi:hypothetical protein
VTVDRRTVILGVAAAGAVAAAVSVTVLGHNSKGSKERRAVTAYIGRVNTIQNQMHAPLTRVLLAYRDFSGKGGNRKHAASELAAASATLARLDRRLAAVPAPPEARVLRRRILALVAQQAAITREVHSLATFAPGFAGLLARARVANVKLGRALQAVPVPKPHTLHGTKKQVLAAQRAYKAQSGAAAAAQADAIDVYDAELVTLVHRLAKLQPPPVLKPSYNAQLRAFRAIAASGSQLSAELRKADRANIATLGRRFELSSRIAQSVAAQRAEIAAIKAYNARARAIGAASGRVQEELARLQRDLP